MLFSFAMAFNLPAAYAKENPVYSHKKSGAIKGTDPVAYFSLQPGDKAVKGNKNISHEWQGATWYFSSEKNRDLFIQAPEKYAPQYGGYCSYAVAKGYTAKIDPNAWTIVNDKLYLNYSKGVQKKWNKKRDEFIQKANSNWPKVLE